MLQSNIFIFRTNGKLYGDKSGFWRYLYCSSMKWKCQTNFTYYQHGHYLQSHFLWRQSSGPLDCSREQNQINIKSGTYFIIYYIMYYQVHQPEQARKILLYDIISDPTVSSILLTSGSYQIYSFDQMVISNSYFVSFGFCQKFSE